MSEFQKLLQKKKAERDRNIEKMDIDPCQAVDLDISQRRRPLFESTNTSPVQAHKKAKTEDDVAKQRRREKLARLAANLRACDQADQGGDVEIQPSPIRSDSPGPDPQPVTPSTKRSKWAQMAAERQMWDQEFDSKPLPSNNLLKSSNTEMITPDPSSADFENDFETETETLTDCPTPNTAQAQVTAALARVGKSATELKSNSQKKSSSNLTPVKSTTSNLNGTKSRAPKPEMSRPNQVSVETPQSNRFENRKIDKNASLLELAKNSKVNKLISHFSPCPSNTQTPRQDNLPQILRETRNDQSDELVESTNQAADESVNTTMSEDITESSTVIDSSDSSNQMDLSNNGPRMQSTQISENIESFQLDETKDRSEEVTGYQRGHSLSFVNSQFEFLQSTSNIKRELETVREPAEILKECDTSRTCFEAGDSPNTSKLKKRKSICVRGSADDMALADFNPKSLQSFRKTQRLKRYEAKATAQSIFKASESGNNLVTIDLEKRKKDLKDEIEAQMNIIRQSSAALSVCTDKRHGKGTYTQVAAEKCLLVASKRFETATNALQNIKDKKIENEASFGKITVGDIHLRTRYQETFDSPQHVNSTYWLLAIVSCGDEDFVTEAKEIKNVREQKSVVLQADFTFSNVTSDFIVDITIYCMTTKQVPETRPKQSGLKIFSQKLGFKRSNSKDKFAQASVNPALFSPGGPNAVRKSNFRTIGVGKIDMDTAQKFEQFRLSNSTWDSVIQSIIAVKVEPRFTKSFEMASFLTVRKGGESGYGDWIRLWGVLSRDRITFWKYPEDREDLPAEGYISLRYIVNQNVTTAKRALTSRPNTLELYSKPLKEGQKRNPTHFEGIVTSYDVKKFVRFLLSSDTAAEKEEWCVALNRTLADLRAWEPGLPEPEADSLAD